MQSKSFLKNFDFIVRLYCSFRNFSGNFNLRMGTPRLVNSQPRLMRPGVNLNYIPDNFNNHAGYGYVQRYPAPGLTYRYTVLCMNCIILNLPRSIYGSKQLNIRAPMYHNVYQHLPEDYHQPYGDQLVNYVEIQDSAPVPSPQWSQSDYLYGTACGQNIKPFMTFL